MKKIYVLLIASAMFISNVAKADEGMWLLSLLEKLNYKDMQAKGLRLTPEQLYSVNHSSLKDACIWFFIPSGGIYTFIGTHLERLMWQ